MDAMSEYQCGCIDIDIVARALIFAFLFLWRLTVDCLSFLFFMAKCRYENQRDKRCLVYICRCYCCGGGCLLVANDCDGGGFSALAANPRALAKCLFWAFVCHVGGDDDGHDAARRVALV